MKSIIRRTFIATTAMALTATAAFAGDTLKFRFADELDSCVTALNDEINLDGVYRVRHIVTDYDTRRGGFALRITTQTFSASAEKTYAAYCLAQGSQKPARLEIEEVAG